MSAVGDARKRTAEAAVGGGEGDANVVQRIVNAWDCCGTCAGGVLAAHVRSERDAALAEVERRIVDEVGEDIGDESKCECTGCRALRIVREVRAARATPTETPPALTGDCRECGRPGSEHTTGSYGINVVCPPRNSDG